jgi:tRNA (mo5U34)-methyltransferase
MDPAARVQVREQLLSLAPWRKGPFRIDDILIDAEWRSYMKWQRLQDAIAPLSGRRVLDVGCGNGYYALRMRLAGADLVIGTDPTLLFLVQFAAVTRFAVTQPVHLLPLRLQQLPPAGPEFDSTFSMGVLYHQRDPREHLQQLRETLRPGGELVLETLIAPGTESAVLVPGGRYARMRNVWHLPTGPRLVGWLESSGFRNSRFIDTGNTTIHEQRSTEWMPFESLQQALGRDDPTATVEGLPAPRRALLTAQRA